MTQFQQGIYETLITRLLHDKLESLASSYSIYTKELDAAEAAEYLSRFLTKVLFTALESLPNNDNRLAHQITLSNELIKWLANYLSNASISESIIDTQGHLLSALFNTTNPVAANLKDYIARITPLTGLAQSELFTGSNVGLPLEAELKREILSADEICWLVSFIKWTGIRIFADVLQEVTANGKKVRIVTTSYMGATDQKAIDFLSRLPNTEVRLNYNTDRERLHAKAYLFLRNSGFDTGYIGSSNISRSALTNGLEWNVKITTQEIPHIIEKFKSTFETYWESNDFVQYHADDDNHRQRLTKALRQQRGQGGQEEPQLFFDIEPHAYQREILERLTVERGMHNRFRNLIVAATGTGKTVISAFDFRRFLQSNPMARFLFVAHREEILRQARATFRAILRSHSFGELWVGGHEPEHFNQLFASVQTLNSRFDKLPLTADFYDYIVIDEVHHIAADSYRPIIDRFNPKILLGLTATPERHDGSDILQDFCNTIAAELRLPEAINQRHLCPFQYFGIDDPVDLSNMQWVRGRYLPSELTRIYTANDLRVGHIIRNMEDILDNIHACKALAFCVSQEHAQFMCEKFLLKGIKSAVLTSSNAQDRVTLREQLVSGAINVLFVVDIFNEGVDIPEVDTVLFLRPTESLTVFLQQLGRGLRLSEGKECLTVLDFVGNAHAEYDFSNKFRALVGKSYMAISDEIENDFPHLPLGCSIVLQKQAKSLILRNIRNAVVNQQKLISYLRSYSHQTTLPLTISNFLRQHPNVTIEDVYKKRIDGGGGWSRLCIQAGITKDQIDTQIEKAMFRGISNRLLQCNSLSYLDFLLHLFQNEGSWDQNTAIDNQFALMAHYDFWQKPVQEYGFSSIEESLATITRDQLLQAECIAVIEHMLQRIDTAEQSMKIGFPSALQIHARYSRDQILAAFGKHNATNRFSSREGVVEVSAMNVELLFVTLQKTEKKFSPTTLYHDYAINDYLFHWQSQNAARPDRGKGLSYVEHQERGKRIILFVREQTTDEWGRTMGFINLGPVTLVSHSGSQPMNITWRLDHPLPPTLWSSAAKLSVG